ncbi:MAG: hypothetical protein ACRD59_15135 [Candidatus Acidiferrales bacterium]
MENQVDFSGEIEKLRREIYWTRCLSAVAILCIGAVSVANWMRHPKSIAANEFLVTDRSGQIVARLGHDKYNDTCLTLTAKQQVSIASLCVQDDEGSSLDLHNMKTESRVLLTPGFNTIEPASQFQPALIISDGKNDRFTEVTPLPR